MLQTTTHTHYNHLDGRVVRQAAASPQQTGSADRLGSKGFITVSPARRAEDRPPALQFSRQQGSCFTRTSTFWKNGFIWHGDERSALGIYIGDIISQVRRGRHEETSERGSDLLIWERKQSNLYMRYCNMTHDCRGNRNCDVIFAGLRTKQAGSLYVCGIWFAALDMSGAPHTVFLILKSKMCSSSDHGHIAISIPFNCAVLRKLLQDVPETRSPLCYLTPTHGFTWRLKMFIWVSKQVNRRSTKPLLKHLFNLISF